MKAARAVAPVAVGFDFDHTLGVDNALERTVALAVAAQATRLQRVGYDEPAAEIGIDGALGAYRGGRSTLDAALGGFFADMLGGRGDIPALVQSFRAQSVARAPEFVRALPGAVDVLASLAARGVPHAIFTNGWSPLQEAKALAIGYTGALFVSDVVGVRKPLAAAFDVLAAALGVPIASLWYVGDDPLVDVDGARSAGAVGVWFDWEGHPFPNGMVAPAHVIHELRTLDVLLRGRMDEMAKPAP